MAVMGSAENNEHSEFRGVFVQGDPKSLEPLPYYKDLNRDDFEYDEAYMLERVKRGMSAGYTFLQCQEHWFCDFEKALYKESDNSRAEKKDGDETELEGQGKPDHLH